MKEIKLYLISTQDFLVIFDTCLIFHKTKNDTSNGSYFNINLIQLFALLKNTLLELEKLATCYTTRLKHICAWTPPTKTNTSERFYKMMNEHKILRLHRNKLTAYERTRLFLVIRTLNFISIKLILKWRFVFNERAKRKLEL
jgi:hypothetical protein